MFSFQESFLFTLWTALCAVYEESALHRLLAAAGRWCNAQIDGSRVLGVLCREGAAARAWAGSRTCRVLSGLANLPGALLHRLYRALKRPFDESYFANLAFSMGDETAIAESWLIVLLWSIPFERWNNAYSDEMSTAALPPAARRLRSDAVRTALTVTSTHSRHTV